MTELLLKPKDLATYVQYRRQHIDPHMRDTDGFHGTQLLRLLEQTATNDSVVIVMLNRWRDIGVQRRFARFMTDSGHREAVKPLIQTVSVEFLERVDAISFESGNGDSPTSTFQIERHRCQPGQSKSYVAALHGLVENLRRRTECLAVTVSADINDQDSFVVIYEWSNDGPGVSPAPAAGIVVDGLRSVAQYELVHH